MGGAAGCGLDGVHGTRGFALDILDFLVSRALRVRDSQPNAKPDGPSPTV